MKQLFGITLCCLIAVASYGQNDTTNTKSNSETRVLSSDGTAYTASNGTVYKKGSKITFLSGSGPNNSFRQSNYLLLNIVMPDSPVSSDQAGAEHIILDIRKEKLGAKRVYAIVNAGGTKAAIYIEGAIAAKEIK